MLKFVVVLYRRLDISADRFHAILRDEHGPMAERLPGLRRYVQNHVTPDPNRKHPGWDAVVELCWDDWASMEAAWLTPEGQSATNHLAEFVDLARSTWSVVNEEVRRGGPSESAGRPSKFSVDERQLYPESSRADKRSIKHRGYRTLDDRRRRTE